MSHATAKLNVELAVMLLAAGHDEKALRQHAGFASLRDVREFASRSDTKAEVRRAAEARGLRVGIKGLASIEQILDSESTDGRTRVAAARTALEVAGFLGKEPLLSEKKATRELSVAELNAMIEATRAELQARIAIQSARLTSAALVKLP
jgi:hypothetical protein